MRHALLFRLTGDVTKTDLWRWLSAHEMSQTSQSVPMPYSLSFSVSKTTIIADPWRRRVIIRERQSECTRERERERAHMGFVIILWRHLPESNPTRHTSTHFIDILWDRERVRERERERQRERDRERGWERKRESVWENEECINNQPRASQWRRKKAHSNQIQKQRANQHLTAKREEMRVRLREAKEEFRVASPPARSPNWLGCSWRNDTPPPPPPLSPLSPLSPPSSASAPPRSTVLFLPASPPPTVSPDMRLDPDGSISRSYSPTWFSLQTQRRELHEPLLESVGNRARWWECCKPELQEDDRGEVDDVVDERHEGDHCRDVSCELPGHAVTSKRKRIKPTKTVRTPTKKVPLFLLKKREVSTKKRGFVTNEHLMSARIYCTEIDASPRKDSISWRDKRNCESCWEEKLWKRGSKRRRKTLAHCESQERNWLQKEPTTRRERSKGSYLHIKYSSYITHKIPKNNGEETNSSDGKNR